MLAGTTQKYYAGMTAAFFAEQDAKSQISGSEETSFSTQFKLHIPKKRCPYEERSKDGMINYNGVTFMCDFKHNAITLGDVSDKRNTLNISLPSGGNLIVNVNNFDELSRAAGMFSAEDLNAILNAIHLYKHCTAKLNEIEDEENQSIEENAEHMSETQTAEEKKEQSDAYWSEPMTAMEQISAYKQTIWQKIIHGKSEEKFQIGNDESTIKEWDKLIARIDHSLDEIKEGIREQNEQDMEDAARQKEVYGQIRQSMIYI